MMEIQVKLFGDMREYLPKECDGSPFMLEIKSGDTVGDVIRMLKIPDDRTKNILVDGVHSIPEQVLKRGASLSFFSIVSGG